MLKRSPDDRGICLFYVEDPAQQPVTLAFPSSPTGFQEKGEPVVICGGS